MLEVKKTSRPLNSILRQQATRFDYQVILLVLAWLGIGLVTFVVGLLGWLKNLPLYLLYIFPLLLLGKILSTTISELKATSWLLLLILAILLLHAVGVFMPETAFDAVWYHLPVVDSFLEHGKIFFDPNLYQTANPLLGTIIFLPAYQLAGSLGTKIVAYVLGVTLFIVVYAFARDMFSQEYKAWLLISVLLIQPITWQFSSFYVDMMKAIFDLCMLLVVHKAFSKKGTVLVLGLLFAASVATKAFSILLLPFVVAVLIVKRVHVRDLAYLSFGMLLLLLFYSYIFIQTGDVFFPITQHLLKLHEIGGESRISGYLLERSTSVMLAAHQLLVATDYVSLLVFTGMPFILAQFFRKQQLAWYLLLMFVLNQLAIWWLVPPLSTRYALAGFIVLVLLIIKSIERYERALSGESKKRFQLAMTAMFLIVTTWHLLPRFLVLERSVPYLTGEITRSEYIRSKFDGNIDLHLERWYQLEPE